ncbi:STE3-domain-containing protein, partial [Coniophora puteana RWD-64-598 SS2]
GSVLYIFWTGVLCIVVAVNAVGWNNTIANFAPVWCDLTSRLIIGGAVAIPGATLCINRRLNQILKLQYQRDRVGTAISIPRDERITFWQSFHNAFVDACIGLGFPALAILLYYVVQQYRFAIVEDVGCYPAI